MATIDCQYQTNYKWYYMAKGALDTSMTKVANIHTVITTQWEQCQGLSISLL